MNKIISKIIEWVYDPATFLNDEKNCKAEITNIVNNHVSEQLILSGVSKRLNLIEIDKLLDLAYMNVEGDGFSDENDVIKYKNEWRKKIGYSKQDL